MNRSYFSEITGFLLEEYAHPVYTCPRKMKRKAFIPIVIFIALLALPCTSHAFFPWWAGAAEKLAYKLLLSSATPEDILEKALTSDDPEKVEVCLDKLIEQKNYIYISRVKMRVENKIRDMRKEMLVSQAPINPEAIQKKLKPWIQVREKAQYFFTRKETIQTDLKP